MSKEIIAWKLPESTWKQCPASLCEWEVQVLAGALRKKGVRQVESTEASRSFERYRNIGWAMCRGHHGGREGERFGEGRCVLSI